MNSKEINEHVESWTSHNLNWDEDEVVWTAAYDDGILIEYFTKLLNKMRDHASQVKETRMKLE